MSHENSEKILVWDIGIRLFHWSLVALFMLSYLSREMHDLHTWSGYAVIILLAFRLLWGFTGTRYARFNDFLYHPAEVMQYIKGVVRGNPQHYTGHNPAGSWMIYAMLLTFILICFSGLKALAEEGEGPFARVHFNLISTVYAHGKVDHGDSQPSNVQAPPTTTGEQRSSLPTTSPSNIVQRGIQDADKVSFWADFHNVLVNIMLWLVGIHILGVIVSSRLHRENLVKVMITGKKQH